MDSENGGSSVESVVDDVKNSVNDEGTHERIDLNLGNNGSCSNDVDKLEGEGDHIVDSEKLDSGDLEGKGNEVGESTNSPPMNLEGKGDEIGVLTNSPPMNLESKDNKIGHLTKSPLVNLEGSDNVIGKPTSGDPPMTSESPGESRGSPNVTAKKGVGLKKWRRVRRDVAMDKSAAVDSSKALKRGLSVSANPMKPLHHSVEASQHSEGSVGSVNMLEKGPGNSNLYIEGSNLDGRLVAGLDFDAATDSENSKDQGSVSSTAASVPKMMDFSAVLGPSRDRNKAKSMSGKSLNNSTQKAQQGKGRSETSKKPRGERIKVEKENSHSSMESDSRSSNFFFMQGAFSPTSNGRKSKSYDSDDAQASEQHFNDDVQTGYSNDNVNEVEDISHQDLAANLSWEGKEEKRGNHRSSKSLDPLAESVIMLQSVQEALEKEVQKFKEIGKENGFSSADSEIHPSSSDQLGFEDIGESESCSLETQVVSLTQKILSLESRLEEAKTMLELKEARIVELEDKINTSNFPKDEPESTIEQDMVRNMETEIEGLFKQKIEAEVEYLATISTVQDIRTNAGNDITLYKEQKALAEEQAQMINKLEETESKAGTLKKQAKELETYCEDIRETEEVLKMQKRVCKVTWCLFIQLILLLVLLGLFVKQLSPHFAVDVVPT